MICDVFFCKVFFFLISSLMLDVDVDLVSEKFSRFFLLIFPKDSHRLLRIYGKWIFSLSLSLSFISPLIHLLGFWVLIGGY